MAKLVRAWAAMEQSTKCARYSRNTSLLGLPRAPPDSLHDPQRVGRIRPPLLPCQWLPETCQKAPLASLCRSLSTQSLPTTTPQKGSCGLCWLVGWLVGLVGAPFPHRIFILFFSFALKRPPPSILLLHFFYRHDPRFASEGPGLIFSGDSLVDVRRQSWLSPC